MTTETTRKAYKTRYRGTTSRDAPESRRCNNDECGRKFKPRTRFMFFCDDCKRAPKWIRGMDAVHTVGVSSSRRSRDSR